MTVRKVACKWSMISLGDKMYGMQDPVIPRRYVAFISSTEADLNQHRSVVFDAVLRSGHIPTGMELFHPNEMDNKSYVEEKIQQSDFVILILGPRYGKPFKILGDISFTHHEYRFAKSLGKNIIAFSLNDDVYEKLDVRTETKNFFKEVRDDMQWMGKYDLAQPNSLLRELTSAISRITNSMQDQRIGGLVPGSVFDAMANRKLLTQDQTNCPIFTEIVDGLAKFTIPTIRSRISKHLKSESAKLFWSRFQTPLLFGEVDSIFFEAGSTIDAFCSYLLELLQEQEHLRKEGSPTIKLFFNGVYAKVLYDLRRRELPNIESISYFPKPPILNKYGKTVGRLSYLKHLDPIEFDNPKYAEEAAKEVSALAGEFQDEVGGKSVSLISFGALDVDNEFEPYTLGYRNCLFKRALWETETNFVICLTQDKLCRSNEISDDHYKIYCAESWKCLLKKKPVAVVLSHDFNNNRNDDFGAFLSTLGHKLLRERHVPSTEIGVQIFANKKFAENLHIKH